MIIDPLWWVTQGLSLCDPVQVSTIHHKRIFSPAYLYLEQYSHAHSHFPPKHRNERSGTDSHPLAKYLVFTWIRQHGEG